MRPSPYECRARLRSQQSPLTPCQLAWQVFLAGLHALLPRRSNHSFVTVQNVADPHQDDIVLDIDDGTKTFVLNNSRPQLNSNFNNIELAVKT